MLRVVPLVLLAVVCVFVGLVARANVTQQHVLEIYHLSSLRLIGLLPVFIPAVRNALDVAGDVLLYIAPSDSGLSTRALLEDRLADVLVASSPGSAFEFTVLAHSQGSLVAASCLAKGAPSVTAFVTVGSPLAAMYARFLQIPTPAPGVCWINLYRDADYLAGPIVSATKPPNQCIGPGGHTGYWSDPRLSKHL